MPEVTCVKNEIILSEQHKSDGIERRELLQKAVTLWLTEALAGEAPPSGSSDSFDKGGERNSLRDLYPVE